MHQKAPKQEVTSIIVVGCASEKAALMCQSKDILVSEVYVDKRFLQQPHLCERKLPIFKKIAGGLFEEVEHIHTFAQVREEVESMHQVCQTHLHHSLKTACLASLSRGQANFAFTLYFAVNTV